MLNTQGISGLSGPNGASSFIPVWVDKLHPGSPLVACLIFGMRKLELPSQEFLNALMFWRWFNPILGTLMFQRRRSPTTKRASNAHGGVFDARSVVSGDSILDIRQETKSNDDQ
ncbi:hypothetical protein JB92DRAFT_2831944 [Gautieria morchelliformis]|nr:hypothetical protein JB92DRAFT_2831944 [Gautieria morchelliformis]